METASIRLGGREALGTEPLDSRGTEVPFLALPTNAPADAYKVFGKGTSEQATGFMIRAPDAFVITEEKTLKQPAAETRNREPWLVFVQYAAHSRPEY